MSRTLSLILIMLAGFTALFAGFAFDHVASFREARS